MKFLVAGDSFAILDKQSKHWCHNWASLYSSQTIHTGMAGGGHVNIAEQFKKDLVDIDLVFYFVTDYTRASVDFNYSIVTALKFFNAVSKTPIKLSKTLKKDINLSNSVSLSNVDLLQEQENRVLKDFYAGVDPEWLFKTNHMSMLYAMKRIKEQNIPIVAVITQNGNSLTSKSLFPDADLIVPISELNTTGGKYHEDSENHFDLEQHLLMAQTFEDNIKNNPKYKVIKTVVNK